MAHIQFVLPLLDQGRVYMVLSELSRKHDWRMEINWNRQWDSLMSLAHLGFPETWITSCLEGKEAMLACSPWKLYPIHEHCRQLPAICVEGLIMGQCLCIIRHVQPTPHLENHLVFFIKRPLNFPFLRETCSDFPP